MRATFYGDLSVSGTVLGVLCGFFLSIHSHFSSVNSTLSHSLFPHPLSSNRGAEYLLPVKHVTWEKNSKAEKVIQGLPLCSGANPHSLEAGPSTTYFPSDL